MSTLNKATCIVECELWALRVPLARTSTLPCITHPQQQCPAWLPCCAAGRAVPCPGPSPLEPPGHRTRGWPGHHRQQSVGVVRYTGKRSKQRHIETTVRARSGSTHTYTHIHIHTHAHTHAAQTCTYTHIHIHTPQGKGGGTKSRRSVRTQDTLLCVRETARLSAAFFFFVLGCPPLPVLVPCSAAGWHRSAGPIHTAVCDALAAGGG